MYANVLLDIALLNAEKGGILSVGALHISPATTKVRYFAVI